MQQLSNFEAAPNKIENNSLTTDNLSSNLFNFIRDDLNGNPMQGSSLIQPDVPEAFRGGGDVEIFDNSVGKSLTKQGVLTEAENGGSPVRSRMDRSNRAPDEMPSSGRPSGATGEGHVGRSAASDQRSSAVGNRSNDVVDEMPSLGRPMGSKAEAPMGRSASGDQRSSDSSNRKNDATDEMPSTDKPAGATGETKLRGTTSGEQRSSAADNRKIDARKEMPSTGKPAGAKAEGQLRHGSPIDQVLRGINNKKNYAVDEAPSMGKPSGAVPESRLRAKDAVTGSSVANPVQQNRGTEVEGRKPNKVGKPETLNAPYEYGYM